MPRGGTRPGEEVRDGPHNNNRCGGNLCGVAPTAAPLKPRVGPGLSGLGLYNAPGRAGWSHPAARPSPCPLEALRLVAGGETMSTPGAPGTTPHPGVLRLIVLGAPASPASLIGSEFSVYLAPALRLAPVL
jgi:hypothetical protein